jgi:hypothetical protein
MGTHCAWAMSSTATRGKSGPPSSTWLRRSSRCSRRTLVAKMAL